MRFPESRLAHHYIWPLVDRGHRGIELGGSSHNWWGDKIRRATLNVDYTDSMDTVFKKAEVELCGEALPVDVVAYADRLPFNDSQFHWAIHSHSIEHVANPIRAHHEWHRVLKDGGIVFGHIPHRDAHPPDRLRPITTLDHLVTDYQNNLDEDSHPFGGDTQIDCRGGHYHVFTLESYLSMIDWITEFVAPFEVLETQEVDEKAGNSFVVVLGVLK